MWMIHEFCVILSLRWLIPHTNGVLTGPQIRNDGSSVACCPCNDSYGQWKGAGGRPELNFFKRKRLCRQQIVHQMIKQIKYRNMRCWMLNVVCCMKTPKTENRNRMPRWKWNRKPFRDQHPNAVNLCRYHFLCELRCYCCWSVCWR